MTTILGLSAFYHDSAAALLVDGRLVAAAQEERFSRRKHDERFPTQAVAFCLKEAGIEVEDLDWVGFYDKPLLKFERLLETYLAVAPQGLRSFRAAMPPWLSGKLSLPRLIRQELGEAYQRRVVFAKHHQSHAASAFYPSPFEEAAILTVDGVGEWATASFGTGRGQRITLTHQLRFPHSLGLLYSAFTYYCGFRVNSGEYKLMGLAPYGEPTFADLIRDRLLDLKADGSFRMDMRYFNYCQGLTMTSARFHRLFGDPPRRPESPIEQKHMDLAASVQAVTEEILLRMARHVYQSTGMDRLCLAGGVALNAVANGRLLLEGPFQDIWIQPAAGDAGGALGVAQLIWHQLLDNPRTPQEPDGQNGSLLGPSFDDQAIERYLRSLEVPYLRCEDKESLCEAVASELADGKVIGWFQGPMEFGPRALGARSILGDPRRPDMQSAMNRKIKFRESFRPFAPSVLKEKAAEFFGLPEGSVSPYMLLVLPVLGIPESTSNGTPNAPTGFDRLQVPRGPIPAVTHVDGSARLQTVDEQRNPLYHRLLSAFEQRTGCPALINTSFNVRGEPIVSTPADAYRCFRSTDIDVLALGSFLLRKSDLPTLDHKEVNAHLAQFPLD